MLQGKGFADKTSQDFGQGKLPAATVMKIQKLRKIREVLPNLTPSFAHPLVGPRWPVLHMKRVSGVTFIPTKEGNVMPPTLLSLLLDGRRETCSTPRHMVDR